MSDIKRINGLTEQQSKFIDERIKCENNKIAAINAGYSERSAYAKGAQLWARADIQNEFYKRKSATGAADLPTKEEMASLLADLANGRGQSSVTAAGTYIKLMGMGEEKDDKDYKPMFSVTYLRSGEDEGSISADSGDKSIEPGVNE